MIPVSQQYIDFSTPRPKRVTVKIQLVNILFEPGRDANLGFYGWIIYIPTHINAKLQHKIQDCIKTYNYVGKLSTNSTMVQSPYLALQ